MTVQDTAIVFSSTANGVTTAFPMTNCLVYDEDHIVVQVDGTTQTIATDYTVSGVGSSSGPTVNFLVAPANGTTVLRYREVPYEQQTDLVNYEGPPLDTIETAIDLTVMQTAQLNESKNRAIRFPIGENYDAHLPPLSESGGKYLYRNLDGTIGAADGTTDTPISSAMTDFVSSATLADARTELDVYSKSETDANVGGDIPVSQISPVTTARLIGRTTAGSGDAEQITVGAGLSLESGNLKVAAGGVVQSVRTEVTSIITGTTVLPYDDTPPLQTEGVEVLTQAVTPKFSTSKLKIGIQIASLEHSASVQMTVALFRDSTANAIAAWSLTNNTGTNSGCFEFESDATDTTASTFKVRVGSAAAGTIRFNGNVSGRLYGGVAASSITITEIAA